MSGIQPTLPRLQSGEPTDMTSDDANGIATAVSGTRGDRGMGKRLASRRDHAAAR